MELGKVPPHDIEAEQAILGCMLTDRDSVISAIEVLKEVEFVMIFSFIYSKREGTPAAKMDFVLTEDEIHKNFNTLLEVQNEISKRKNDAYVGRICSVLVEGVSKTNQETLTGRTDSSKIVNFKGDPSLKGTYVNVKITEAHTWSLNGEIVE